VNVDDELDRLYGLPLEEFTAARNTLAREARKAGEREAADQLKTLPKPPISAWVVNQLARRQRMQVRSLLTAGERLRKAQEQLLRGGSPNELQEAFERQREVVAALLESAKEILGSAGHPATEATLERVRGTLSAAAGSEEAKRLVQEGRLTEDLDPAGFGPLALGTGAGPPLRKSAPPGAKSKPDRREETTARKKRIEDAKRELDSLRAEVTERTGQVRRAHSEARRAARAAEAAQKAAEKQEKELDQLRTRLEAAKSEFGRARST
jgi:hypothetical protein